MRRTGKIISMALPATAVACAPSTTGGQPAAAPATALPSASLDASFDLQALVAAAKKDGGVLVGQLMPRGVTRTRVPADLQEQIPAENHNPLLALSKATIFACNTKPSPGGCPVRNVWDLTEPEWAGKLVMQDPLGKPTVLSFFTQLDSHGNEGLEQAYQAKYGKALKTEEKNAAHEWIKRISLNKPVLTGSDEDISAAVGAPDTTDKKLRHPSAAKLLVHFVMTEEDVKHEIGEGGISGTARSSRWSRRPACPTGRASSRRGPSFSCHVRAPICPVI
ncbi:ABC transporter substrate-binding protein [Nonomuraea zeae]|uniref:ABC transporter substrate-binding protein n=1 Tax=Nonomuraea zeae TaxID=1642303 RepID=A0A5S4FE54_9ACTN|nr:ABC transporter substrate-binding protein [Nonomuraea zeae]TMR16970.1 ABC transporter substrate-binding protein [Nonomuraea zeae]